MRLIPTLLIFNYATSQFVPEPAPEDEVLDGFLQLDESLSDMQKTVLKGMINAKEKMDNSPLRTFSMFSKMAFWAIVTAVTFDPEGEFSVDVSEDEVSSISSLNLTQITANGDIDLQAATEWFDKTYTRHGCYCWPEGQRNITGFGIPLDPIDHVCHQLYMCYKCLNLNPQCKHKVIDSQRWDYHCVLFASEDGNLELTCNDEDPCLRAACECDKAFSFDAIHARKDDQWANAFATECHPGQHSRSNKACCGDWPYVRIYSQEIQCCGDDMKLHSWGQIEAGGQCEAQNGDAPSLGVLMEQLDAEMEVLQISAEDVSEEVHDHSSHDGSDPNDHEGHFEGMDMTNFDHSASQVSHEDFHAQNQGIESDASQIHEAFHQMENMHGELHEMGANSETAPNLHNQFHDQADGAMDAMNGMIMGRSGMNPEMDIQARQRSVQNMVQMQQQLQQSIMQMQQMMYQYNQIQVIQQANQTPNMRAIQGPYTCKSCKQALEMKAMTPIAAPVIAGITNSGVMAENSMFMDPRSGMQNGGFASIVNPVGLAPVAAPETEETRQKREIMPEKPQAKGDIWNRLHNIK